MKFQGNGFDCIESEKFKEAVYVQTFGHAKNPQKWVGKEFWLTGGERQKINNWIQTFQTSSSC